MKKIFKRIAAMALVGLVGISSVACAGGVEKPEWLEQLLCEHDFEDETVIKEATCTEKGKAEKTCSDCGKTETVATKKLPHVDENGDKTCDVCGTSMSSGSGNTNTARTMEIVTEVPVRIGENVIGNTYRLYLNDASSPDQLSLSDCDGISFVYNDRYTNASVFSSGPRWNLDGLELTKTDKYMDITFKAVPVRLNSNAVLS